MRKETIDFVMAKQALMELDRIVARHPELVCHDGDRWEDDIDGLCNMLDREEEDFEPVKRKPGRPKKVRIN